MYRYQAGRWTFRLLVALLMSGAVSSGAYAQVAATTGPLLGVIPTTADHPAGLSTGQPVRHTGTDAISYFNQDDQNDPLNGQSMQVMTWDEGNNVLVAWDFYNDASGNINDLVPAPGRLGLKIDANTDNARPDPDVVVAYGKDGELYANLVYISGDRIQYQVYLWDAPNKKFKPQGSPRPLGDNRFIHSYPNIDANAAGLVAVTWQQTATDSVKVSVVSTSNYFASYDFKQQVTFGRAVVAGGTITGGFTPCYYNVLSQSYGLYVLDPPTGLFEQTLHPDVAISEADANGNGVVISSTFIRHYVDGRGLFSINNKLAVVQSSYDICNPEELKRLTIADQNEWNYSTGDVIGTPRIAAPPFIMYSQFRTQDVEVVVDRTITSCGSAQYNIWNFGKSEGAFRDLYTQISPLGNPSLIRSVEPAIAFSTRDPYHFGDSTTSVRSNYMITWTGGTGYDKGEADDIWAVTLYDGIHFDPNNTHIRTGPAAQPTGYNRVNFFAPSDQSWSSVAGRHMETYYVPQHSASNFAAPTGVAPGPHPCVHLWSNPAKKEVDYRRSGIEAGAGNAFRPTPPSNPGSAAGSGLLQAYPNPSTGRVSISLGLQPGETLRRLLVLDALGRPVAELPAPNGAAEWQPAPGTPAGLYTLRAETNQRTTSQRISRQ